MTVQIGELNVGVSVIIPAAGVGKRIGGGTAKQFLPLRGLPVLKRTVQLFSDCPLVDEIVVVAQDLESTRALVGSLPKVTRIVHGGPTRQDSVFQGLKHVTTRPRILAVHDAARPLLPAEVLERVLRRAAEYPAQVVAVRVKDTIKRIHQDLVDTTLDREELWAAQTPQVFWAEPLMAAFRAAEADGYQGTDCASLLERIGVPVMVCEGSHENLKLTTPEDFILAEAIIAERQK